MPKDVQIADFDADFVDLAWKKPEGDGGSPITGYIIEKRDRYRYITLAAAEFLSTFITS